MAILPRAALLLALAVAFAPAVAAEESGESAPPSGDSPPSSDGGNSTSDPVEDIEDCVCNETGNQTTGNETEPECTLPSCVTDPDERAACAPAGLDPFADDMGNVVHIDPDGCYSAAIKK